MVAVFKNVGETSTAKNCCPFSLLSVVSKVFEKLVNNKIVNDLEKCGLFSKFQCGFRCCGSTADLLTVVSDRIARTFNNRIVDDLEKCGIFSDFQYGFRSSRSTDDLLTNASDKIASTFNRSGGT